jgi:hypothetical protein
MLTPLVQNSRPSLAVSSGADRKLATKQLWQCSASLSSMSIPVPVPVPVPVPLSCPLGKWCTAGLVVDCPLGTYNPLENQDFATACIMCPPSSYTAETNSTSRAACACDEGFYDANASTAIDQDLIDAMVAAGKDPITMQADVVDCQVCPYGTDCGPGSTIEALPLVRGFYRIGDDNVDVRKCPDADSNCSTTFGTDVCESTSGCVGGKNASNLCGPGLSGTFCRICDPAEGVFYVTATATQPAYCKDCGNNLTQTAVIGVAGLAGLLLVALGVARLKRKRSFAYFLETFTPQNKLKIVRSFSAPAPTRISARAPLSWSAGLLSRVLVSLLGST